MQENQQPCQRIWPSTGVAYHEILQWEHGKDHRGHGDTGDEDPPQAKMVNEARKDGKLENAVHAPGYRHPQTDRRRTKAESTQLDWRRPSERDECRSRYISE